MSNKDYLHPPITQIDEEESARSFATGGKIMLTTIVVLICVVFFMLALHLYARWYLIRARHRQIMRRRTRLAQARSQFVFYVDNDPTTFITPYSGGGGGNMGLDSSVLRSLPVFEYSVKPEPEPLDCAVCLSEFEDGEKGRLLPKCGHSFHIDCIDMWFNSHSNCPICRSAVEPFTEPAEMSVSVVEPAGSSNTFCEHCQHNQEVEVEVEEENSSTTSLGSRRKGFEVRIEVPNRNELDDELTPSSPASGAYKSPGTRLFSQSMKRILSMGGRRTPTGETPTTSSVAATSIGSTAEFDLELGHSELPPSRTPM